MRDARAVTILMKETDDESEIGCDRGKSNLDG